MNFDKLIGLSLEEAQKLTEFTLRAIRVDNKAVMATRDYRTDRINVHVESGKITKVSHVG